MSDAKQLLFTVEPDSAMQERDSATPPLKPWVTPKVITASLEDAEHNVSPGADTAGDS